MFTGIVETMGVVQRVQHRPGQSRIELDIGGLVGVSVGDSLSVSGVCLTVTDVDGTVVGLDVVTETLDRTNLGELADGALVNLERAMPAMGRFDGHVVQGHIDGLGTVVSVDSGDSSTTVTLEAPSELSRYMVEKGSVTVDGVSLTVAAIGDGLLEIALIPYTLAHTTLGLRNPGDTVNLEVDVLAKYVERLLNTE